MHSKLRKVSLCHMQTVKATLTVTVSLCHMQTVMATLTFTMSLCHMQTLNANSESHTHCHLEKNRHTCMHMFKCQRVHYCMYLHRTMV